MSAQQEHRLGRWWRHPDAKSGLVVVRLPQGGAQNGHAAHDSDSDSDSGSDSGSDAVWANDAPLPLTKGTSIAVVGPLANATTTLISDYETGCPEAPNLSLLPSIASAIAAANTGGTTTVCGSVEMKFGKLSKPNCAQKARRGISF